MDLTFILSAIIFTLLAIVVATSIFNGSSSSADFARGCFGQTGEAKAGGLNSSDLKQNCHLPGEKKAVEDWGEVSGSSHDHWDVVKSVLSEETHSHLDTEERATPVEYSTSTSSLSSYSPASRDMSFDSSSEASLGRGQRSFIGLSDKELLKCAFSYPQTEGAAESPGINDKVEANANNSLKYVPGVMRTNHMQMMMSKDELEQEQRVQREQLAAIFQLLKQNKETFGEVSEGDIEEQLKLYSI